MERYSRVALYEDDEKKVRVINSGIENDPRIIVDSYKQQLLHKPGDERLLTAEIIRKSEDVDANFSENIVMTELYLGKGPCNLGVSNCTDFCCVAEARS